MKKLSKLTQSIRHLFTMLCGAILFFICPRLMLNHQKNGRHLYNGIMPIADFMIISGVFLKILFQPSGCYGQGLWH